MVGVAINYAEDNPGSRSKPVRQKIAAFQMTFGQHTPRNFLFGRLWRHDLLTKLFEHSFTGRKGLRYRIPTDRGPIPNQ